MAVGRRSLAFAVLLAGLTYPIGIGVWGALDAAAQPLMDQPSWGNASHHEETAPNATNASEYAAQGQRDFAKIWRIGPFLLSLAVGISVLIRSRGDGGGR